MPNIDQLNETLRKEIAGVVAEVINLPEGIITIMAVEADTNFFSATIYFSVLPDKFTGTALEKLKKSSGLITRELKNRVKLRKMPHLIWRFDPTEKNASSLDKTFEKINQKFSDEEVENMADVKYE